MSSDMRLAVRIFDTTNTAFLRTKLPRKKSFIAAYIMSNIKSMYAEIITVTAAAEIISSRDATELRLRF